MLCFMPHPKITHTHLQRHRPKWWEDIISAGTWNKKWKANHSKNKPRQHLDFSLWTSQLWCCFSHKCCQDHLPKTAHGRIFFPPWTNAQLSCQLTVLSTSHKFILKYYKITSPHLRSHYSQAIMYICECLDTRKAQTGNILKSKKKFAVSRAVPWDSRRFLKKKKKTSDCYCKRRKKRQIRKMRTWQSTRSAIMRLQGIIEFSQG